MRTLSLYLYHALYQQMFRAQRLSYQRKWQRSNRSKTRKYCKKHFRENPTWYRSRNARKRAQIKVARLGDPKAVAKVYARAAELRQWFDVVVDHIIPLCRGGDHSVENLQIIYSHENLRKNSSLSYKPQIIFR